MFIIVAFLERIATRSYPIILYSDGGGGENTGCYKAMLTINDYDTRFMLYCEVAQKNTRKVLRFWLYKNRSHRIEKNEKE